MRTAGLIGCVLLLAACESSSVAVRPTPSVASPFVTPPITGPAPTSCPGPKPRTVAPQLGPAIGEAPVYAVGAVDADGVMHFDDALQTRYGREVKIVWAVQIGFGGPISLSAMTADSSGLLYFVLGDQATTSPVLEPQPLGDWWTATSYLDVPAPGCYFLQARWAGGSWRLEFPAGE